MPENRLGTIASARNSLRIRVALALLAVGLGAMAASPRGSAPHGSPTQPPIQTALATPPIPPSPVDEFRRLLSLQPAQRDGELAKWPEGSRQTLRRKLAEYEAMPSAEAQLRLKATELRHYLEPLMTADPKDRANGVLAVPERLRHLVEARLQEWDAIPARERRDLLENDATLKYFSRPRPAPHHQTATIGMPPEIDPLLQARLKRWREMNVADRSKASERIQKFFELPAPEQRKTLDALSPQEREEIQASLQRFTQMPREQRQACVAAFEKLASMDPAERREFLRNAERWRAMSPLEREQWRKLVHSLPPLPPVASATPPLPPAAF